MTRGRACITWRTIAMGFPRQRGWQGFGSEGGRWCSLDCGEVVGSLCFLKTR